jgi:hypothetical protein
MDKKGYLHKLRLFLADPDGKIWKDEELYSILEDALKKYGKDSGFFTGSFSFIPDRAGNYSYPENFAGFMVGWNITGQVITQTTAKDLFDRSGRNFSVKGNVDFIYDDRSGYGNFMVYPAPDNMQNRRNISFSSDFGEVSTDDYGVFNDENYGVTADMYIADYAGEIYYRKTGNFEDVKDYMAVIYYAMHLAYSADSEFGNSDMAAYWLGMYRERLAVAGRVSFSNSGKSSAENFF